MTVQVSIVVVVVAREKERERERERVRASEKFFEECNDKMTENPLRPIMLCFFINYTRIGIYRVHSAKQTSTAYRCITTHTRWQDNTTVGNIHY